MQVTIKATAEELFCGDYSADADITVTFELYPAERATRDYPGCPASAELVGWEIEKYSIYDTDGNLVAHATQGGGAPDWIKTAVDGWVNENDGSLIDDACEEAASAEEYYAEERYARRYDY